MVLLESGDTMRCRHYKERLKDRNWRLELLLRPPRLCRDVLVWPWFEDGYAAATGKQLSVDQIVTESGEGRARVCVF